jgi:hypothetical protein
MWKVRRPLRACLTVTHFYDAVFRIHSFVLYYIFTGTLMKLLLINDALPIKVPGQYYLHRCVTLFIETYIGRTLRFFLYLITNNV